MNARNNESTSISEFVAIVAIGHLPLGHIRPIGVRHYNPNSNPRDREGGNWPVTSNELVYFTFQSIEP